MAHLERGAYEPRITNLQPFDADEDDATEEGSRLPILIAVALLVLLAFAGVVWLAYTQGVQRGRADAPRTIAESTQAPGSADNTQAAQTPYAGLKIYQPPSAPDEETDSVPPPPTPAKPSPATPVLRPSAGSAVEANAASPSPAAKPKPVAVRPSVTEPAKPAPARLAATEPSPTKTTAVPPAPPPQVASHPPRSLMKPAVDTTPAAPVAAAPAPAPAPAAAEPTVPAPTIRQASSSSGGYMVQVGSYKSQSEANESWQSFRSKYGVTDYGSDVKEVDLGDKGTWYRLRLGPFQDKDSASAYCAKLKAQGASCLIAH